MAATFPANTNDRLKKMRGAIHTKRRQIDLADDAYRALLMRVAGVKSSRELNTFAAAGAVLDALHQLGAPDTPRTARARYAGAPHNLAGSPSMQKIGALLADMQEPWGYAVTIAERVTGGKKPTSIKELAWVRDPKHLVAIIAALDEEKKRRLREMRDDLGEAIAVRGLMPQWAKDQAEAMGRLTQPWPWYDCLETLRLIAGRLPKVETV